MDTIQENRWKKLITAHISSVKERQIFISPEIPQKLFNSCIKSYAKYVTSRGEKILALYDGGRSGKEGLAFTESSIAYRDAYDNFGGFPYEHIISYQVDKGGDPEHPFPVLTIHSKDGTVCAIGFMENPLAAPVFSELMKAVIEENRAAESQAVQCMEGLTIEDQWGHIIRDYLPHIPLEGLFKSPYIPEKQIAVAIESYGKDHAVDEVLALFEYKTHGSEGFLLTRRGLLYCMGYENWGALSYDVISRVEYSMQRLLNSDVPALSIRTKDGRDVELQFIIHPSIARHLYEILDKGILLNNTCRPEDKTAGQHSISEMIDHFLPHDPANRIYKMPSIPEETLSAFRTYFPEAFSKENEKILALYDNSRNETGENGCVMTDTALHIKNSRMKTDTILYMRIEGFEIDSGRHHNDIRIVTSDGSPHTLSFHLYKKAQDEFLHFLRQAFPGKETAAGTHRSETRTMPVKKYIYVSRKLIAGLIPPELSAAIVLISMVLLIPADYPPALYLFSLIWFFSLVLFGLTLSSSRSEFLKNMTVLKKTPHILNSEAAGRVHEQVITSGTIQQAHCMLDGEVLYRERYEQEEHASAIRRLLARSRKVLSYQAVPFYINDGSGKLLVIIQDALTGIFNNRDRALHPGDTIHLCGTIIKNPYSRDFSESDFALAKSPPPGTVPLILSDSEKDMGMTPHDRKLTIFELSTGWLSILLGLAGGGSLFFIKTIAHQKGIELILNLFTGGN